MTTERTAEHDGQSKEIRAIGFRVGNEEYGLALESVQEVITVPRITRVPNAPSYIQGVINLHGNVIPVVDVARRFNIGQTAISANSRIVVVDTEDEVIGLLAEEVSKVTRLNSSDIQPPPPLVAGIEAEYLEGVVHLQDRFLIFLDLKNTLATDDSRPGTGDSAES